MKTKRFKISSLRHNAWFQFFTDFKALVETNNPQTLNIEQLFAVFLSLYADADEAMKFISKSAISEELNEADQLRDTSFRGFSNAVKSFYGHFDKDKSSAAKRIGVVLDSYGNLSRKPLNEETSGIYNLTQEMRGKYAPDVALLGLSDWVDKMDSDNKAYENLARSRDSEAAERSALRMKEVRSEADRNYLSILERIDALMLINGEAAHLPFVKEQHALVNRYR